MSLHLLPARTDARGVRRTPGRRRAAAWALGATLPLTLLLGPTGPAATTSSASAAGSTTPIGQRTVAGWRLDLDDSFNSLNTRTWSVKDRASNSNEESRLLARNVTVSGGVLRVQGKKESVDGRRYTSGYLHSRGKYTLPDRFRVEIRAQVPLEMGMWAAPMWFRPSDGSGGEIDLLETYGADRQKFGEYRAHHTIHTAYGRYHQTNQKQRRIPGDPLAWHVYTIEKTAGRIDMYVDGQLNGSWYQGDPSWFNTYYERGKRWAMIMNLQIGGHRGSPNSSTNWAADKTAMRIDYVRTWVK